MRQGVLDIAGAAERVGGYGHGVFALAGRTVQRDVVGAFDIGLPAPERVHVHVQMRRQFPVVGRAAIRALKGFASGGEIACLATDGARHMILLAQLIENRAADSRGRKGAEGEAARQVEALECGHEADRAGAHQLIEIGACGNRARDLMRHMMDEAEMLFEEHRARRLIAGPV